MIGPFGGLQLTPDGGREAEGRNLLAQYLAQRPAGADEVTKTWVDLARYYSLAWNIQWSVEEGRFTLTMPEEPRKLGIVPSEPDYAIIFATGNIVEVCKASDYLEHVQELSRNLRKLVVMARDELESR